MNVDTHGVFRNACADGFTDRDISGEWMEAFPTLIDIRGLKTTFDTEDGVVRAVDDLSLSIREGHTLGLVGESGSGKSVTSLSIMRLLPETSASIDAGEIAFLGKIWFVCRNATCSRFAAATSA